MPAKKFNATSRYPVGYRCQHCRASGFTAKDGSPSGRGWKTCPTCQYGALEKMTWNGCAWH